MNRVLCSHILDLLGNTNGPVSIPQMHMVVRSLDPDNVNLQHEIKEYVKKLQNIGLVKENSGLYKFSVSLNPIIPDNLRVKLIADPVPTSLLLPGRSNPSVVLPGSEDASRAGSSSGRRGKKRKPESSHEETPAPKRQNTEMEHEPENNKGRGRAAKNNKRTNRGRKSQSKK